MVNSVNDSIIDSITTEKYLCRICLDPTEAPLTIYENASEDDMKIYQKIEECCGQELILEPGLPDRICEHCKTFLDFSYKFRMMCKRSEEYLRKYVLKIDSLTNFDDTTEVEFLEDKGNEFFSVEEDESGNEQLVQDDIHYLIYDDDGQQSIVPTETQGDIDCNENEAEELKANDATSSKGAAVQLHVCKICDNKYPRKAAYVLHMRRHRKDLPFECEICHNKFQMNFQLMRHMRIHTGLRPFACSYCERRFSDRSTLVKHERTHRNERPYACEICGKAFTYANVLKAHMLTHTGEKRFMCGICNKRFTQPHHLRAHLSTLLHQGHPKLSELLAKLHEK